MAVYELEVVQMIVFFEGNSKFNPTSVFVSQNLALSDLAKNFRQWFSASNHLYLAQLAQCHKSVVNLTVSQYLELHDGGHKAVGQEDIVQYLIIGHVARVVEYEVIVDTLTITQTVEVTKCHPAFQTLVLTQTVGVIAIRNIEVVQSVVLHSGGVAYIEDKDKFNIILPTLSGPNAPECHP